jgi:hypothetical protein
VRGLSVEDGGCALGEGVGLLLPPETFFFVCAGGRYFAIGCMSDYCLGFDNRCWEKWSSTGASYQQLESASSSAYLSPCSLPPPWLQWLLHLV